MTKKHPFSVIDGGEPDDKVPLRKLAQNAGYVKPVREKSPIIEKLKDFYDEGISCRFKHVMVFWDTKHRQPKHYGINTLQESRIILSKRASEGKLDLLAVLDMKDPFENQIYSDAHQKVTSWPALGNYCEEDIKCFLDSINAQVRPKRIANILLPIQVAFDEAWKNNKTGLLVYVKPDDTLVFKATGKDDDLQSTHITVSFRDLDATLILALDTKRRLEDQIPKELYENAISFLPFRSEPMDTLGAIRRMISKDISHKPPSPFRS